MLLDPTIIAAIAQASPWAAVAGILAWAVVALVDGKTGMGARRAEIRALQAQSVQLQADLARERERGDRLERIATQREP